MTAADIIASRRAEFSSAPKIWSAIGLLCVLLAAAPSLGLPPFAQSLVIEALIFSLLALSSTFCLVTRAWFHSVTRHFSRSRATRSASSHQAGQPKSS